ncbi:SH3 beta-barrel fold-containing protein [Chryseobacterium indologenes]|uniref:SH3 beta-barrel fold-containing protein n=1 Tax=Chryseobacterium indologenes TaxID=253 RepID=UPI0009EB98A5|nr:SH3 beta-barrel fold-containing protein [Chryseobacterium indologenes]
MKTSNTFRKTVMLRAYHIMQETGKEWAECLRKAWQLYRINKEMHQGEVTFYFEKKDGSIRKAIGTLKIDYEFKTQSQPSTSTFSYFDVDINDWRCFKIANFIGLATVDHFMPLMTELPTGSNYIKPKAQNLRNRRQKLISK